MRSKCERKPDVFIVGAPKCATTALYTYLKSHPEIFMSPLKEPHFFTDDTRRSDRPVRTYSQYAACFAGATTEKRVGEASTSYLSSPSAPGCIKSFNAAARIIIMLRNPLEMMYSLHSEMVYEGGEPISSFQAALGQSGKRAIGTRQPLGGELLLPYRQIAAYSAHVRRYFELFGRENTHVILYEDFKKNIPSTYKDVLKFLDVCPDFVPAFAVINANRRARSQGVQRLVRTPPPSLQRLVHAVLPLPARRFFGGCLRWLNTEVKPRPPMNGVLRALLQEELEPEVNELSRLLDRDLSVWREDTDYASQNRLSS